MNKGITVMFGQDIPNQKVKKQLTAIHSFEQLKLQYRHLFGIEPQKGIQAYYSHTKNNPFTLIHTHSFSQAYKFLQLNPQIYLIVPGHSDSIQLLKEEIQCIEGNFNIQKFADKVIRNGKSKKVIEGCIKIIKQLQEQKEEADMESRKRYGQALQGLTLQELQQRQARTIYSLYRLQCLKKQMQICNICLSQQSSNAFVPCGHNILCDDCAKQKYKSCPKCKVPVNQTIHIFN